MHENESGHEFRFVLPGPQVTQAEWQGALDFVAGLEPAPRWIVASGGLAPGMPVDFYARLARLARARGARIAVDTSGAPLSAALIEGVDLIKPSLNELRGLTGLALDDEPAWAGAAREIVQAGRSRAVALSLGDRGALLVTADEEIRAPALDVPVASTIGAGDSFTAAMVWAFDQDLCARDALRWAMAASAAALLFEGTALCQRADVERLLAQVRVL